MPLAIHLPMHLPARRRMPRSQRAHDLRTARQIGSTVFDFCGLLVGLAIALSLLGAP